MFRLLKSKFIIIFSLMFIAGFVIGYDYAVLTSRGPAAASVKGSVMPADTVNEKADRDESGTSAEKTAAGAAGYGMPEDAELTGDAP